MFFPNPSLILGPLISSSLGRRVGRGFLFTTSISMFIKQHFRVQESCIKLTICLLYSLGSKHFLARTRAATLVTQPRLRKGERFIVLILCSALLCFSLFYVWGTGHKGFHSRIIFSTIDLIHDIRSLNALKDWWGKSNVTWFLRVQTNDIFCQYKKSQSSLVILDNRKWRDCYLKTIIENYGWKWSLPLLWMQERE